jgi:hypothetical protein
MRLAYHAAPEFKEDLQWRMTYALFLPLFVLCEGVTRLFARYAADDSEQPRARGSWAAEARSQASIATSCALMAKSMLQSSERRNRAERLSRP